LWQNNRIKSIEKYSFEGITAVPFCTSGSSGIGQSGSSEASGRIAENRNGKALRACDFREGNALISVSLTWKLWPDSAKAELIGSV